MNHLQFIFKLFVSLTLIGGLIWHADAPKLLHSLAQLPWYISLIVTSLFSLQLFFATIRWFYILKTYKKTISLARVLEVNVIGTFLQSFFIGSLGGALAKIALIKRLHVPLTISTLTLVMDRAVIVLVLLGITILFSPFLPQALLWGSSTLAFVFVGFFISAVLCLIFFRKNWQNNRNKYKKYLAQLENFFPSLWKAVLFSFISLLFYFFGVYLMTLHLHLSVSFWQICLIMPAVALISSLPVSLNGWGIRETAMVVGLGFFDVQKEDAIALSIFVGVLTLLSIFPLFVPSLINRNKTIVESIRYR